MFTLRRLPIFSRMVVYCEIPGLEGRTTLAEFWTVPDMIWF